MGRALRVWSGDRSELFLTTKMWRKYHGYEATLRNLDTSLKRLQTDYVDLWLIHWPGPAYSTMNRRKDLIEEHGIEYYFKVGFNSGLPCLATVNISMKCCNEMRHSP